MSLQNRKPDTDQKIRDWPLDRQSIEQPRAGLLAPLEDTHIQVSNREYIVRQKTVNMPRRQKAQYVQHYG